MKTKNYTIMANAKSAIGTHSGALTKHLKGKLKAGMLVCFDTDEHHVKACPKGQMPWGIALRDSNFSDEVIGIQPLASCGQTACLLLSQSVKAGQLLCLADNGCTKAAAEKDDQPIIGIALTDGQKGDHIEAITTLPYTLEIKK